MSILYITEFPVTNALGSDIPTEQGTDQIVTFTTTTQSTAFKNNTQLVRLHTDSNCSVAFGTNPTATVTNRRLAANQTEYYRVSTNSGLKVAAINNP